MLVPATALLRFLVLFAETLSAFLGILKLCANSITFGQVLLYSTRKSSDSVFVVVPVHINQGLHFSSSSIYG